MFLGLQVEEFEAEIEALQNTKRKAKPPPRLVGNTWLRGMRIAACSVWHQGHSSNQKVCLLPSLAFLWQSVTANPKKGLIMLIAAACSTASLHAECFTTHI